MTCIAAIKDKDSVWMCGDSAGVQQSSLFCTVRLDKKVFLKEEFVTGTVFAFGFTSSFRMGQLIQYSFHLPPVAGDLHEYMSTIFINELRDCLKFGGYTTVEANKEIGGQFMVGVKGRLFTVDEDFQVEENAFSYSACGCGNELALGSLFSTEGSKMKPEDRLKLALRAAECFSGGVRGPFHMVKS